MGIHLPKETAFWLRVPNYHGCNSLVCSFSCPSRCPQPHYVSIKISKWSLLPMTILVKLGGHSTNTHGGMKSVTDVTALLHKSGVKSCRHTHTDTHSLTQMHTPSLLILFFLTNAHKLPRYPSLTYCTSIYTHPSFFDTHIYLLECSSSFAVVPVER